MKKEIEITFIKNAKSSEYYKQKGEEPRLFIHVFIDSEYVDSCSFTRDKVTTDLFKPTRAILGIKEKDLHSYLSIPKLREIYDRYYTELKSEGE